MLRENANEPVYHHQRPAGCCELEEQGAHPETIARANREKTEVCSASRSSKLFPAAAWCRESCESVMLRFLKPLWSKVMLYPKHFWLSAPHLHHLGAQCA